MKVPYVEDLANHRSPESCGGYGNVRSVDRGKRRRAIELRNHLDSGADLVH
jgi:hypothetical protein